MKASRRREARQEPGPIPTTLGEALHLCPFRSLIGIGGGNAEEMESRIAHTFAALGGEPCSIKPDLLDEMTASIRAGGVVLVMSDRADLRDHVKREILTRLHGAAGCA